MSVSQESRHGLVESSTEGLRKLPSKCHSLAVVSLRVSWERSASKITQAVVGRIHFFLLVGWRASAFRVSQRPPSAPRHHPQSHAMRASQHREPTPWQLAFLKLVYKLEFTARWALQSSVGNYIHCVNFAVFCGLEASYRSHSHSRRGYCAEAKY